MDTSSESTRRRSTGQMAGTAAGAGYSGFVARNVFQQESALRGGAVNPSSRLGAMMHSRAFGPGTVGFGVHPNIRAIHSVLGNIGQSNIGSLFASPSAQRLMASPIGSSANAMMATTEHGFWGTRLSGQGAHGASTMGERVGGMLGTAARPSARSFLQSAMHSVRTLSPMMAVRSPQAAAIAGGLAFSYRSFTGGSHNP